jgi:hypothetical protein
MKLKIAFIFRKISRTAFVIGTLSLIMGFVLSFMSVPASASVDDIGESIAQSQANNQINACTLAFKCEQETGCEPDPYSSWSAPAGYQICEIAIKAGTHYMAFSSDGCADVSPPGGDGIPDYCVSGVGTDFGEAERLCEENGQTQCYAVSHSEFYIDSLPSTPTPTNTSVPPSPTPTNTSIPPSPTPTNTSIPPSPTPTNTSVPPSPTPTNTSVPPSPTPTYTETPIPATETPTNTPTNTLIPTETGVPGTSTPTVTGTPPTPTMTDTPTSTSTATSTATSTSTGTSTPLATVTGNPTSTATATATSTATSTFTPTTTQTQIVATVTGVGPTDTPESPATLPPPSSGVTTPALVPVTGADLSTPVNQGSVVAGLLINIGLGMIGLALVSHGLGKRLSSL